MGLTGDRLVECDRDREESNRRYDEAFKVVLSHTSTLELHEFWKLFAMEPGDGAAQLGEFRHKEQGDGFGVGIGTLFSPEDALFSLDNPMTKDMKAVEAVKGVKAAGSGFVRSRTLTQNLPPDMGVTTDWSSNPMTAVEQEGGGGGGNQLEVVL
jgi:hypothetical protein